SSGGVCLRVRTVAAGRKSPKDTPIIIHRYTSSRPNPPYASPPDRFRGGQSILDSVWPRGYNGKGYRMDPAPDFWGAGSVYSWSARRIRFLPLFMHSDAIGDARP